MDSNEISLYILIVLCVFYIVFILLEFKLNKYYRKKINLVIHVNGIRGKSSVTRLLYAIFKGNGYNAFAKTTGTLPMYIDTKSNEILIKRSGRANIKEQLKVLKKASEEKAEVLICECMAINPLLQKISNDKIIMPNASVITNVRMDHMDEMGDTLQKIANSLCNVISKDSVVFTSEKEQLNQINEYAKKYNSICILNKEYEENIDDDFKENINLVLTIGEYYNLDIKKSIYGIKKYYIKDPFSLSIYKLKNGSIFINGFSINDLYSIKSNYYYLQNKYQFEDVILLINNRFDRPLRTMQMIQFIIEMKMQYIWITGDNKNFIKRKILKGLHVKEIKFFNNSNEIYNNMKNNKKTIFAFGNIHNQGFELVKLIKEEGEYIGR
ncbi:MAG: poly-gamma-glutamate synthase PgsB [Eubacteriales bacterium]|nr:poly-gamma-glutamate synthase PgsB [Eubacteriales bacterium]